MSVKNETMHVYEFKYTITSTDSDGIKPNGKIHIATNKMTDGTIDIMINNESGKNFNLGSYSPKKNEDRSISEYIIDLLNDSPLFYHLKELKECIRNYDIFDKKDSFNKLNFSLKTDHLTINYSLVRLF